MAAALTAAGPGSCVALPGDLGSPEGCEAAAKRLAELEPKLHGERLKPFTHALEGLTAPAATRSALACLSETTDAFFGDVPAAAFPMQKFS